MTVAYVNAPLPHAKDAPLQALPPRDLKKAVRNGAVCRCPSCGEGAIFDGYLAVNPSCSACGEELHHHRADDAPPYFTIMIIGHIIIPLVLAVEVAFFPPIWVHMAIWLPLTVLSSLAILRPIKGALIALQWAKYMHGFDPNSDDRDLPIVHNSVNAAT